MEAVNGSTVMLPCTYSSCIGIKDLYFNWQFNDNGTMKRVSLQVMLVSCRCPLDPWQLVGLFRCVSRWSRRRGWCPLWKSCESASSLWATTSTTTSPSCCGTSPLRTEASTRVSGSTPKRRARTTAPPLSSSWWTSVSGRIQRRPRFGLGYLDTPQSTTIIKPLTPTIQTRQPELGYNKDLPWSPRGLWLHHRLLRSWGVDCCSITWWNRSGPNTEPWVDPVEDRQLSVADSGVLLRKVGLLFID